MAKRVAGLAVGLVFGFTIVWSGMTSPEVIRGALLFEQSYLFLFFASAVVTATIGLALVRRLEVRALLTGERVSWARERVERRHVVGAFLFGIGWGIADVCPGPLATQLGQGIAWSLFTATGVVLGLRIFMGRGHEETEPAAEPAVPQETARVPVAAA
jgi:uncharacterized protein